MAKKVIRLNESDINRLVKKVIKESNESAEFKQVIDTINDYFLNVDESNEDLLEKIQHLKHELKIWENEYTLRSKSWSHPKNRANLEKI